MPRSKRLLRCAYRCLGSGAVTAYGTEDGQVQTVSVPAQIARKRPLARKATEGERGPRSLVRKPVRVAGPLL
jgi:hypothetical protein